MKNQTVAHIMKMNTAHSTRRVSNYMQNQNSAGQPGVYSSNHDNVSSSSKQSKNAQQPQNLPLPRVNSKKRPSRMASGQGMHDDGVQKKNQFVDDVDLLAELEEKLFGSSKPKDASEHYISDKDFVPLKTGVPGYKLMKYGPKHIMDADQFEPLYIHQENILEDCLNREAEKVAHQENLMNRVVYDSENNKVEPKKEEGKGEQGQPETDQSNMLNLPTVNNCDNSAHYENYYTPQSENDYTLTFESRFESGNLRRAIQVYEFEYDLILKPDYLTKTNNQWFYFRLQNTRKGRTYRFNIINLLKPDSLYNHGMQPLMYSETSAIEKGKGWQRVGKDVCYYQNSIKKKQAGCYYTLTFSLQFDYDGDTVYFAHSYPYTYTDLCRYLSKLESDPQAKNRFRRKMICQTNAGNPCDMLTITTFSDNEQQMKAKKAIILSSRVHPGETGASYMMKGVIDFLVGPSIQARILRDNFIFKIIPMINPDGVILGNTRCSLAGVDLNRHWQDPNKEQHPVLYQLKQMIRKTQEERDVMLFVDFHGHSRKKNIFMYGNSAKNDTKFRERIFPFMLEKQAEVFSYTDCAFSVQKSKEGTGRVVGWKELGIQNSFTLEASFCGSDFGKYADLHFNTTLLQEIGHHFCENIIQYIQLDPLKIKQIVLEIEDIMINQTQYDKQAQLQLETDLKH